jgi:hypothetical protein
VGFDVRGIKRSTIPIDQGSFIRRRLHDLEQALPSAIA